MGRGRLCSGCFPQPVCEVNLIRCLSGKSLMGSVLVEETEVGLKSFSQFGNTVVGVQVDVLVLHRAPEPFDKDVVHPSPLAIHADLDLVGLQDASELLAGELSASVQKSVVMVFDSLQDRTLREAQSITATR